MSSTLKDLVSTSFQFGKSGKGVLTTEEAAAKPNRIVDIGSLKHNVFFFSDDHIFGYPFLPKDFVPCSTRLGTTAVARPAIPDGRVDTIEQYIEVFHKGDRQITSIEELVEFLDSLVEIEETPLKGN